GAGGAPPPAPPAAPRPTESGGRAARAAPAAAGAPDGPTATGAFPAARTGGPGPAATGAFAASQTGAFPAPRTGAFGAPPRPGGPGGPAAPPPAGPHPGAPAPFGPPYGHHPHPGGHPVHGYHPGAYPYPPRRGRGATAVWVAVGGSAFTAVVALTLCVALVVAADPGAGPSAGGQAPSGDDPAAHYDERLAARPGAIDLDVAEHPAYDLAMPESIDCAPPDLDPASDASWRTFSDEVGRCLNELWQPRLEELGLRTPEPTWDVTEENPDTGSAEEGMTLAYYENDTMTITVVLPNVSELARDVPDNSQESVWAALLGHEYGHHVQQATGILEESYAMERQAPTEDAELEALRRTELQAECMAGVAMQAMGGFDQAEIDRANTFLNSGSDLPTHGTSANRQEWFDNGASADTLEACNTYGAPVADVD
ncbi:neutral zinc metallopeptidase, partial [Streptomonospora nanhaiensis]|uniref:neutral zinc metallopeptidase n=1 Tax=Streptomonospora nanhaiensis TaxID=1323731 RepID=UPI003612A497